MLEIPTILSVHDRMGESFQHTVHLSQKATQVAQQVGHLGVDARHHPPRQIRHHPHLVADAVLPLDRRAARARSGRTHPMERRRRMMLGQKIEDFLS